MPAKANLEVIPGVFVTAKHERFIREVLIDNNARRAFEAAGYSLRGNEETIKHAVNDLLHDERTEQALKVLRTELNQRLDITAERVLQEIAAIAFSDLDEFFTDAWGPKDKSELPAGLTKLLASVKIRETITKEGQTVKTTQITLLDKLSALDKLAKQLQLYQEQPSVLMAFDWASEMERARERAKGSRLQ